MSRPLSRRRFLNNAISGGATLASAISLGGICQTLLSGCSSTSQTDSRQFNMLNWADYLHPDTIAGFEKRYQVKVVQDTFASNEALLAKLQAGGSRYDLIVPSSYMVKQLRKLDVLANLDHGRLKNLANLLPRFRSPAFDPGLKVSVPYTWGTTGLGFDLDYMQQVRGGNFDRPNSGSSGLAWDALFDERFKNRLTMLEDSREVIGSVLKMQGYSYNTKDESRIRAATELLKGQKPLVMCYTSDQVIVELASGDSYLSQVYSGDCYQARRENKKLRYAIPTDGCSIWTDNFCIPKTAPNPQLAYLWIDYMLEPELAAACANFTHYATANEKAFKLVDSELVSDPGLYPGERILARCEEIADVGDALFLYDRMWTELKCS